MNLNSNLINAGIALIAGILILIQPHLLSIVVALYLIIAGVFGLAAHFNKKRA
ncbi:MAG: uncharacterized membrane protein HdeD (DUF308 family) [Verrucomicrobiales bacterium]|jgi:uncharacterized membrane protein HdeD (DUF308 family)